MFKLSYIICYILFLIAVILVFAIISNTPGGTVTFYIFMFIVLLLGSALFGLALLSMKTVNADNTEAARVSPNSSGNVPETDQIVTEETEQAIDIHKLLPAKSTEINRYAEELIQNMANTFNILQALVYVKSPTKDNFNCIAQYAYFSEAKPKSFKTGEALPGQAVKNKNIVILNNIPDNYMTIISGLGKSKPKHLVFVPLKNQDEILGLIEYATFGAITEKQMETLEEISKKVADTIVKLSKK